MMKIESIRQMLQDAYECGYGDGQNNPNGYSDEKERNAMIHILLSQQDNNEFASPAQDEREASSGITPEWVLGYFDTNLPEAARDAVRYAFAEYAALAIEVRPAQTERAIEGVHCNPYPAKCPVTGLPYFMHLEHPELGVIPTFGGPYDSYSIPCAEGSPEEQWHRRELVSHRFCHDRGHWVDDEFLPLRIIHEDVLSELQDAAEQGVDDLLSWDACRWLL